MRQALSKNVQTPQMIEITWDLPQKTAKKSRTPPAPQNEINTLINSVLIFNESLVRQECVPVAPIIVKQVKTYDNRKAILKDHGGDLSKRWYIEYYIWNVDLKKLVRVREYKGFKDLNTVEGRRIYAKRRMKHINSNLRYCAIMQMPYPDYLEKNPKQSTENYSKTYNLKKAFEHIINISYPESRNKKTRSTYISICAKFYEFCASNNVPLSDCRLIQKVHVQKFVDDLQVVQKLHANTIVSIHSKLKAVFNKMLTREMIEKNPALKIEVPKEVLTTRNVAFNRVEQKKIKEYVQINNPELWNIIQTLYYCFIRSTEMGRLKIENVDLKTKKIYLSGEISKNGKSEFVAIPSPLMKVFEKMDLEQYPSNFYLFGSKGLPNKKKIAPNWIGNAHSKVLKELKIYDKTFYSWKHTGVVEAYQNGVDIKAIQLQCRHASIEQTDQYLKSLGFRENDAFTMGVREI